MRRGDVCWHAFAPPDKQRRVIVLPRDSALAVLDGVTIAFALGLEAHGA
jgi:hypothetical protein